MSNSTIFLKSGFLQSPLENGVGRHVCQLQRLVIKFCKNHGSSRGVRDFIEHEMIDLARNNPGVVVYVKPRRHRSPMLVGEFLNGDRQLISCHGKSREEVAQWINDLIGSAGQSGLRYRKQISTVHPSVQGPWSPFVDTPAEEKPKELSPAMTKILRLAKEQGILKE